MKKIKEWYKEIIDMVSKMMQHHVGAYAAQSAYFFMLSLIPIIILLMTLVRFTPVTLPDVLTAVSLVFPSSVNDMVISIVREVYNLSMAVVPLTIVVALWAAGKGVLSLTTGMNISYECPETRNYVVLRIRATFYTVLFVLVIGLLLLLSVFGKSLSAFVASHFPVLETFIAVTVKVSSYIAPVVLVLFSLSIYKFLPNRKDTFRKQLPGSIFAALGWLVVSWIFSIYLDIFTGFTTMYGSLATIVLIMLWLYFLMYITLLGAEVNQFFYDKIFVDKKPEEEENLAEET